MLPPKSRFPILQAKLSTVCLVLMLLAACDEKCCYGFGKKPDPSCGFGGSGGECGFTQCVSIGVDQVSSACFPHGDNPYFITNAAKRSAKATYTSTTRTNGVQGNPSTFNINLAAGDKLFLGCGHSDGDTISPSQDNFFNLVHYEMLGTTAQASVRPVRLTLDEPKKTAHPTQVQMPKDLDIQACDQLCKQASGKCVFLAADTLITKEQEVGLSKLFISVTKGNASQLPQKTLLQFFGMATDPCSRSATDFKGDKSGQFTNTGTQCALTFQNQAPGSGEHSWLSVPAELAGSFKRDTGSITLTFDSTANQASLQTEGKDGFSRKDFKQVYGTPGRILASAGEKCVEFKYSTTVK
jgi:hypothetical protein